MPESGAVTARGEVLRGQQFVFRAVTAITGTVIGFLSWS